ncbi:hypothetical protein [Candidatus Poriferisodalis sp.]|uniref:hypothetical protein n=1 Tax=Candidatus Poriferisodalis sp. TaxID=3101277 RepID=UPI003AF8FB47
MDSPSPRVSVTEAARRHRIDDEDILHAYRNAMTIEHQDDGFIMITGAKRDGELLEVGFRYDPDSDTNFILHAMFARQQYLRPL